MIVDRDSKVCVAHICLKNMEDIDNEQNEASYFSEFGRLNIVNYSYDTNYYEKNYYYY